MPTKTWTLQPVVLSIVGYLVPITVAITAWLWMFTTAVKEDLAALKASQESIHKSLTDMAEIREIKFSAVERELNALNGRVVLLDERMERLFGGAGRPTYFGTSQKKE